MGASESTAKTNGIGDDEEKSQQESGGISMGVGKAAVELAAAGVAAWGISRMLSENTDDEEKSQQESGGSSMGGGKAAVALAAAGVAAAGVAAWGISRMLSLLGCLLVNSGHTFEGIGKRSIWSPPPRHRFKINTDGRCHSVHGRSYKCPQVPDDDVERKPSGYGGILRDHRGNWVRGFRGYIGVTDSFTAELHGIHKGLELLDKFRHNGAILESDCEAAVLWINKKDHNNTSKSKIIRDSWGIIEDCKRLAGKNDTTVNHIDGKDANQYCAHQLADLAIDKKDKYVEIENLSQLPYEIKRLVDKDAKTNV